MGRRKIASVVLIVPNTKVMDVKSAAVYTVESENSAPLESHLQGPPPPLGFNLEGIDEFNQIQPTVGLPTEPVLLSPQQLPGYPSSPPEYTPYPSNFSNQPSPIPQPMPGYPQTQPGFSHQPGIQHNFPDAETQATVIPVVITATRVTVNRNKGPQQLAIVFAFILCLAIMVPFFVT